MDPWILPAILGLLSGGALSGGKQPTTSPVQTEPALDEQQLAIEAILAQILTGGLQGQTPYADMLSQEALQGFGKPSEEFFRTNIEEPMTKMFTERVLPQVIEGTVGANAFRSTGSQGLQGQAIEDFSNQLVQAKTGLAERSLDRGLQATALAKQPDPYLGAALQFLNFPSMLAYQQQYAPSPFSQIIGLLGDLGAGYLSGGGTL